MNKNILYYTVFFLLLGGFPKVVNAQAKKKKQLLAATTKSHYNEALQMVAQNESARAITHLNKAVAANDSSEYPKALKLLFFLQASLGKQNLAWKNYEEQYRPILLKQMIRGYQSYGIEHPQKREVFDKIILDLQTLLASRFQDRLIRQTALLDSAELFLKKGFTQNSVMQLSRYWQLVKAGAFFEKSRFWFLLGLSFEKPGALFDLNRARKSYLKAQQVESKNFYTTSASKRLKLLY